MMMMRAATLPMVVQIMKKTNAHHIDKQPRHTDPYEPFVIYLYRVKQPLYAFAENIVRNKYKEYPIKQTSNCFNFSLSKREVVLRLRLLGEVGSKKADQKSHAVEEHVECVADQTQAV